VKLTRGGGARNNPEKRREPALRFGLIAAVCCLVASAAVQSQSAEDPTLRAQLERLFPAAESFSPKEGNPPHFKAFGPAQPGGEPALLGLAFWTTELEPLERAYDGPIKMLVGMDTSGVLTGIVVADHREPYGYFSVDLPEFPAQFVGKSVRDRFRYGDDIDAISRATVTVTSASRAVRNSARRVARAYLTPPEQ
jgi:NosR/NirI family transcriptional regulator, nitrous oxide reductase regulator